MIEPPFIIVPRPEIPRTGLISKPYRSPDKHWEEVTMKMYGSIELPMNVYHIHNPEWDREFWSIQSANDQWNGKRVGFWTLIGMIYIFFSTMGFKLFL